MAGSALLPVFWCVSPVLGLVGFLMVMMGIAGRNPKMRNGGVALLVLAAIGILVALLMGGRPGVPVS